MLLVGNDGPELAPARPAVARTCPAQVPPERPAILTATGVRGGRYKR